MAKQFLFGLALLASVSAFGPAAVAADEPSLHQVYQAADAGRLNDAQTMMHQVLQAHPNSGKAHYVEAELLAKQGNFTRAREELATAEKLAPGLPFAKPQAVENLRVLLAAPAAGLKPADSQPTQPGAVAHGSHFPWGMVALGLGALVLIGFAVRRMSQQNRPVYAGGPAYEPTGGNGYQPYGAPYNGNGWGAPQGAAQPGMGSRIMGGLATGAAVGAGVVAGEALMHHFMDDRNDGRPAASPATLDNSRDSYFNDLGGNDFGVADGGSWDDGGGSDNDWN